MGRLAGKVAVVTGGGTGIGRETARLYASEGGRVAVADIRDGDGNETVALIEAAGGEAIFVKVDVSSSSDVKNLYEVIEERYGELHIVTANAGITGRAHQVLFENVDDGDFQQLLDVNLRGVFLTFKHAIDLVRRSGGGAFTATSSLASIRGYIGLSAYSASKAGVNAMVRAMSIELGPEIRVNTVMPGAVLTDVGKHFTEETGRELRPIVLDEVEDKLNWIGGPEQLAGAHMWLVSDEASFVTGQEIAVDGGRSVPVIGSWRNERDD